MWFLLGITFTLCIFLAYRAYILPEQQINFYQTFLDSANTSKNLLIKERVADIKIATATTEEKLLSTNKRFDDFILFGGIIVTLLLVISATVYFKTESEVAKNFDEKFWDYEKKVQDSVTKVEILLNSVAAQAEIMQKINKRLLSNQGRTPT